MFIPDRRSAVLERVYLAYGRRLVRRSFAALRVSGLPQGTSWAADDAPVIFFVNHSAWWDAVIPFVLARDLFRRESYALMEGAQIERHRFFRHLGCFGATTHSVSDARATTRHAERVLTGGRRRALWICPQGALLPARAPLVFGSGLARIARAIPAARVVPVAARYEFANDRRPIAFYRFGHPVDATDCDTPRAATERYRAALAALLSALDDEIAASGKPE